MVDKSSILLNYRLQMTSASISFLSSSCIAGGIIQLDGGLTSPYRRIIFGLSASDILQSLCLLTGPWAPPKSTPTAFWAVGNYHTCRLNGLFFVFASGATPMYMLGLCVYTTLKIKRNISDRTFSKKIEKFMHFLIISSNLSIVFFGLFTKTINSAINGAVCMFSTMPTGCRSFPQLFGECDQSIERYVPTLIHFSSLGIPLSCLFGIICCMILICGEIFRKTKSLERTTRALRLSKEIADCTKLPVIVIPPSSEAGGGHSEASQSREKNLQPIVPSYYADRIKRNGTIFHEEENAVKSSQRGADLLAPKDSQPDRKCSPGVGVSVADINNTRLRLQLQQDDDSSNDEIDSSLQEKHNPSILISRSYRIEIMVQAVYFVLAFFITFVCFWTAQIMFVSEKIPPNFLLVGVSIFYPLGGFFNVLVYCRPKIRIFRLRNPQYSWLRAFWYIIKAGGDAPPRYAGSSNRGADENNNSSNPRGARAPPKSDNHYRAEGVDPNLAFKALQERPSLLQPPSVVGLSGACFYDANISFNSGSPERRSENGDLSGFSHVGGRLCGLYDLAEEGGPRHIESELTEADYDTGGRKD